MSNKMLNIYEFRSRFSYYAKQVLKGRSFVIASRNRAFAEFRPLTTQSGGKLKFGLLKGKFSIPEDFDSPLGEFEKDFYGN